MRLFISSRGKGRMQHATLGGIESVVKERVSIVVLEPCHLKHCQSLSIFVLSLVSRRDCPGPLMRFARQIRSGGNKSYGFAAGKEKGIVLISPKHLFSMQSPHLLGARAFVALGAHCCEPGRVARSDHYFFFLGLQGNCREAHLFPLFGPQTTRDIVIQHHSKPLLLRVPSLTRSST